MFGSNLLSKHLFARHFCFDLSFHGDTISGKQSVTAIDSYITTPASRTSFSNNLATEMISSHVKAYGDGGVSQTE